MQILHLIKGAIKHGAVN